MASTFPRNVTDIIVPNDVCIGCGLCEAVCPVDVLSMAQTPVGELKPNLIGECLPKCDLCLRTCPFFEHQTNQMVLAEKLYGADDGVAYHPHVGWHTASYVGHSLVGEDRKNGASGGMATWFIRECLASGYVDRVINVSKSQIDQRLYDFQIISSVEELGKTQSTRYYAVSLAKVMREVWRGPEQTYLITGVPCFLYAVRLAAEFNPRIRKRVKILLGLVCGQCPNLQFSEYLAAAQGKTPEEVLDINFRTKKPRAVNAYDFDFSVNGTDSPGLLGKSMFGLYGFMWANKFFSHRACHVCDDTFAEVADIVFMDAWLPEYVQDRRGDNLIVVRKPELRAILEAGMAQNTCRLDTVSAEQVLSSQESLVRYKRSDLHDRQERARSAGKWVPKRRPALDQSSDDETLARNAFFLELSEWSKAAWPRYRRWGRIGALLFLLHAFAAHRQNLRHFKEVPSIIPGYRPLMRLKARVIASVTRRIRALRPAVSKD